MKPEGSSVIRAEPGHLPTTGGPPVRPERKPAVQGISEVTMRRCDLHAREPLSPEDAARDAAAETARAAASARAREYRVKQQALEEAERRRAAELEAQLQSNKHKPDPEKERAAAAEAARRSDEERRAYLAQRTPRQHRLSAAPPPGVAAAVTAANARLRTPKRGLATPSSPDLPEKAGEGAPDSPDAGTPGRSRQHRLSAAPPSAVAAAVASTKLWVSAGFFAPCPGNCIPLVTAASCWPEKKISGSNLNSFGARRLLRHL